MHFVLQGFDLLERRADVSTFIEPDFTNQEVVDWDSKKNLVL
jgi:hypothetical protein